MRYLYKINSRYDGFAPQRIPDRLIGGRILKLGWGKYLDVLRLRDEVWVVFTGGRFEPGVYIQGLVAAIDSEAGTIDLRVRASSTTGPLTDPETSAALLDAVNTRYRQVFLWPADRQLRERCEVRDCEKRSCIRCDVWRSIPQIDPAHYLPPRALRTSVVVPAYWIIPARCYLYYGPRNPAPWIRRITEMFNAFKVGEARYAFPLAAGIHAALNDRGEDGFDAIIPVPLSPEKAEANELDRTATLAAELSRLSGVRTRGYLSLAEPISKRRLLAQGYTPAHFQWRYQNALRIDPKVGALRRVILLDDVITKGSTMSVITARLKALNPALEIVVAAAGQMIVKAVVADENGPAW